MTKLTHEIAFKDLWEARENWYRMYYPDRSEFWTFLGRLEVSRYSGKGTERAYHKVQMLASRHHRTLMAAFIAKTGYHKKLPRK